MKKEKKMSRRAKRLSAYILAAALAFSSPFQSLAVGLRSVVRAAVESGESGKVWSVPAELYLGQWENLGNENAESVNSYTNQRIQIKDRALVVQKQDGSYQVRLEYDSYSAFDMIQIVNPDQVEALKTYMNVAENSSGVLEPKMTSAPMGTFNAPSEYIYPSNASKHASYILEEANVFYWNQGEVSVTVGDKEQDTGYITFETDNLEDEWIIRAYFSRQSTFTTAAWPVILRLGSERTELPGNLTIDTSQTQVSYRWTNYADTAKMSEGKRNVSDTAKSILNSLFVEEVAVKKESDGSLKAVFTFNGEILKGFGSENKTDDTVTSVKYAVSRTVDVSSSSLAAHLRQEIVDVTWSENLLNGDGTVEIPFEDLMDNRLFQVSTQQKDTANASQTKELNMGYYYGALWLDGYTGSGDREVTGYQLMPVKQYAGKWENIGSDSPTSVNNTSGLRPQIKDNALVMKNSDGSYDIRLEYYAASAFDMIQMLDPEQVGAFQEAYGSTLMSRSPMGDFNLPEQFNDPTKAQSHISNGYITEEANGFYWSNGEVAVEQADARMDTGYITFHTADLSGEWILRALGSGLSSSSWSLQCVTIILRLDETNVVELADDWMIEGDAGKIGYRWTNYAKPKTITDGRRSNDSSVEEFLYGIFDNTVSFVRTDEGTIKAVFTLKELDDPLTTLRLAVSKNNDFSVSSNPTRMAQEFIDVEWEELYNSDSKMIEIEFDDLTDSKLIEISTVSNDKKNESLPAASSKTNYYGTLWLSEEIRADANERILYSTNNNGARLIGSTLSIPEDATFLCEAVDLPRYFSENGNTMDTIMAFAKSDEDYILYDYYIRDREGNEIIPTSQVTIELPIPESMNPETVLGFYQNGFGSYGYGWPKIGTTVIGEVVKNDLDQWVLRLVPHDVEKTYFSIAIYDPGTPIARSQLEELDEGYYEVRTTIRNTSGNQPSMSNTALYNNRGILHVKEKGSDYDLYLKFRGVMVGTYGYIAKMRVFEEDGKQSELVDVLGYMSTADMRDVEFEESDHTERSEDNLMIDDLCEEEKLHYLYRARLSLTDRYRDSISGWKVGFQVPYMNVFTNQDVSSEKQAYLRIIDGSIKRIDENDLEGYSPSILKKGIDDANWHLSTMEEGTEKETLASAIQNAETEYALQKENLDEEKLLEAVKILAEALNATGGGQADVRLVADGTYKVPYQIYDNNTDNLSQMSGYFSGKADLTVSGDEMTVTLHTLGFNDDYMTRLQYDNGGRLADAEIQYDENGKAVSFSFTRAYTEEKFEIDAYTERKAYQQTLQLLLNLEEAEKVTASDEDVAELNNLLAELKALNTEDYTKASMDALTAAVSDVELVLSQSDYLEYDTLQAQLTKLNTAKDGLVSLVDLKAKVEEAKKVTDAGEDLAAAITAAEAVIAKENASRSEVLAAVSRLNFLMGTNGSVSALEDGMYTVPFEILQDGAVSGSWADVFRQVEVKVEGDTVSLIASMEENDLAQIQFSVSGKDPSNAEVIGKNGSWIERWQGSYLKSADADKALYAYLYQNGASAPEVVEIRLDYSAAQASADKTALYEALLDARAELENSADYTQETVELLKDAFSDAEDILYDYAASQSRTDRAEASLDKAVAGLERAVDRTGLADKIKKAVAYWDQKDVYTESTRNALAVVIEEAREVYGTATVTQDSIDSQIAALEDAVAALEYISREELGDLIEELEGYREAAYTKDSWAKLVTAIKEAKASYEQTDLADQDYKDAKASLQSAADALEELPDVSESLKELDALLDILLGNLEAEELYEPTSYASFMASVAASEDLLDTSNEYELTDEMIEDQMAALEAEFSALIPLEWLSEESLEAESYSYQRISYEAFDLEEELEAEYEETLEEESGSELETELENDLSEESADNRLDSQEKDETLTKENKAEETAAETEKEAKAETEKDTEAETEEEIEVETGKDARAEIEEDTEAETKEDTEAETEEDTEAEAERETREETETEAEDEIEEAAETETKDEEASGQVREKAREKMISLSLRPRFIVFAAASPSNAARKETESDKPVQITKVSATSKTSGTKATSSNITGGTAAYSIDSFGDIFEDGVYCVNFDLWQFAENKESMGNGAVKDAFPDKSGKQAKLVIDGSNAYIYLEFQKMEFNGLTGHLLDMFMMDNLKTDSEGVIDSYDEVAAEVMEYTDEVDDFGPPSGRKYPKLLRFEISKYMAARNQYIPVQVNVPVMGASAEQPAYIRCYWNTLSLVEGAEPDDPIVPDDPDTPDEPVVPLVYDKLEEALDKVSEAKKSDYTAKSYAALEASIKAGDTIFTLEGADQDMIDTRTDALLATYEALVLVSGKDDPGTDPTPGGDDEPSDDPLQAAKEELREAVEAANTYYASNYTDESYKALADAIKAANQVLRNNNATELQIQRALNKLYDAEDNLVARSDGASNTGVDKSELNKWIVRVSGLTSSSYDASVYEQFAGTLKWAKEVYSDADATANEVAAAASSLESAYIMLVTSGSGSSSGSGSGSGSGDSSSDTDKSGSDEDDGYYEVNVRLWHASMNKASMGDPAIVRKAYVHIDDGEITMRLQTKRMTTSGITTHLYEFYIYNDGDYEEADLISTENSRWTYEFPLPNDNNTYYKCKVDPRVDVMGDDPVKARLKVDWKSLDEVDEDDWDDLEGDTDDDDDDDDSSTSYYGTGSTTTLTSEATGIRATGSLNGPGYMLEAVRIYSGSEYDMTSNSLFDAEVNQFALYDVKLRSGNSYVQPTGTVTLNIPIPAGYDTNKLVLYRISEDGTKSQIYGRVNGSYYEASVDHFSLYALAESEQAAAAASAAASGAKNSGSTGTSGNTGTSGSTTRTSSGSTSRTNTGSTSRTTAAKNTGNTSKAKPASTAAATAAHVVAGREIPYTGDPMPVKELACIGFLAMAICLWAADGRKKDGKKGHALRK